MILPENFLRLWTMAEIKPRRSVVGILGELAISIVEAGIQSLTRTVQRYREPSSSIHSVGKAVAEQEAAIPALKEPGGSGSVRCLDHSWRR